ncbi:MAG TPA: ribonuclease H-like domain-containing protein [Candidatus Bathyarchaeia archaeon]|nr:ribonuclease H-like domain-containing protein [Candidatus Bathyarchaeia archaeon]
MVRHHVDLKRELEELKKKAEGVFRPERRTFLHPEGGAPHMERSLSCPEGAVRLADAVRGEEVAFGGGAFLRVLTEASAVWPEALTFHREYLEAIGSPFFPEGRAFEALRPLKSARPESVCYLDIETTGLRMSPLFLVGLMYGSEERLVVDQLFARDYSEEGTVLAYLAELLPRFEILVTFNGITFDVPFIRERMTVHRLSFPAPATHIDILPLSRLVVGARTPNHRLQTLEMHLCARKRVGDIAGSEIPGAYHEFVRTQDARDMAHIIHHNRLDLVTMLQLVTIFLSGRSE